MVRALWGGLRGLARAVLATSLLHIQAHLYLVDSVEDLGHHANRVEQGDIPCSSSLETLIKRAQMTYCRQ